MSKQKIVKIQGVQYPNTDFNLHQYYSFNIRVLPTGPFSVLQKDGLSLVINKTCQVNQKEEGDSTNKHGFSFSLTTDQATDLLLQVGQSIYGPRFQLPPKH